MWSLRVRNDLFMEIFTIYRISFLVGVVLGFLRIELAVQSTWKKPM